MFGKKKGQATIEYLVLLAVAIIIALVIFAFMGWIPGFAGSLKERQVKLYWASQYPIQIREYKFESSGNLTMLVQNVADYQITITSVNTTSTYGNGTVSNGIVLPGQTTTISTNLSSGCTTGQAYEISGISIHYQIKTDGANMGDMVETGDRPLVGTCQ